MAHNVRQSIWDAKFSANEFADKITVRNLQVNVNAGLDAWGRKKTQRALITVTIALARSFNQASFTDKVDESTVHYGKLSKEIQSRLADDSVEWTDTANLSFSVTESVLKAAGPTSLWSIQVDVFYPKASMLGDGAGYQYSAIESSGTYSEVLYLRNVRVPCIIGVNSNERLQKQPVVVNLQIECLPSDWSDKYVEVETELVNIISDTQYETLERLSAWVVQELKDRLFKTAEEQSAFIRLRIEKPMAVLSADAPVIEILRPAKSLV